MEMGLFLKINKGEIDDYINARLEEEDYKPSMEERRLWVLNDELLYLWARMEEVEI